MTSLKFILSIVVFMSLAPFVTAVDLVVTKDGTSFWAQQVKRNDNLITFVCNDSGKSTNIPMQEVYSVVPGVEKGQTYTEEDVQNALRIITKTRLTFGNLLKQLKILQGEWEAVRAASDPEMGNKIAAEVGNFKSSKKDKAAYSQAMLNLGMKSYVDVTGLNSSKLDNAIAAIQQEYMGTNIKKLESMAAAPKISVDEFLKMKGEVLSALKKDLPTDERKRLTAALDKARTTTHNQGISDARGIVAITKNIESYLKSRAILLKLKSSVAETKAEILAVEKAISSVTQNVKSVLPDYDFSNNGYPLTKRARDTLDRTKAYSSSQMVLGTTVDEHCLVILGEAPEPVVAGKRITLPVTLVFNRAPADDSEYSVVIVGLCGSGMSRHHVKLANLILRNGYAGFQFPLDIAVLGQDAVPLRDNSGPYVLLYMASRPLSSEKQDDKANWKAISLACHIPVQ